MNLIPFKRKREDRAATGSEEHPLTRLRSEMDQLFDRFFGGAEWPRLPEPLLGGPGEWPRMDLAETENEIALRFDLPGVSPEDVQVDLSQDVLTVRGETRRERDRKFEQCGYSERSVGSFTRSVRLPTRVDPDKVDAEYRDGVLSVTLRKHPDAQPMRIKVRNA